MRCGRVANAVVATLPTLVSCDRRDVRGVARLDRDDNGDAVRLRKPPILLLPLLVATLAFVAAARVCDVAMVVSCRLHLRCSSTMSSLAVALRTRCMQGRSSVSGGQGQ